MNAQQSLLFLPLNQIDLVELNKKRRCRLRHYRTSQGVGGLDQEQQNFFKHEKVCRRHDVVWLWI
jgi:hypothetical protein